jgi:hypothetical protein
VKAGQALEQPGRALELWEAVPRAWWSSRCLAASSRWSSSRLLAGGPLAGESLGKREASRVETSPWSLWGAEGGTEAMAWNMLPAGGQAAHWRAGCSPRETLCNCCGGRDALREAPGAEAW